jgi:hypothetical protein
MPIIVDEVVISVEVGNGEAGGASPAAAGAVPAGEKQALVEECVARVLEILRDREEP